MTRHSAIVLLICTLLGLVSTLLLAWACAAFVNPDLALADFQHAPRADGGDDVIVAQRGFGHTRINRARCAELRIDPDTGNILMARWAGGGEQSSSSLAGWPLRAFSRDNTAQVTIIAGNSATRTTTIAGSGVRNVRGGWELPPFKAGRLGATWRGIPLQPMWRGLLLDTLILGAAWLVLLTGFGAVRRGRRRARGCCPWCGYDLRSGGVRHERCPECGR